MSKSKRRALQHIERELNQGFMLQVKIEGRDVFNLAFVCDYYKEKKGDVVRRLIRAEYERLCQVVRETSTQSD